METPTKILEDILLLNSVFFRGVLLEKRSGHEGNSWTCKFLECFITFVLRDPSAELQCLQRRIGVSGDKTILV